MHYQFECSIIIDVQANSELEALEKLGQIASKTINGKFESKIVNHIDFLDRLLITEKLLENFYGKKKTNANFVSVIHRILERKEYKDKMIYDDEFSADKLHSIVENYKIIMLRKLIHFLDQTIHGFFSNGGQYTPPKHIPDTDFDLNFIKAINDTTMLYEIPSESSYRKCIDWMPFRNELKKRVESGEVPFK